MTKLKAVIPVAGLGMRMLPATKAIPKEMLPIVDKPLIQYVVNECVAAGIKEIILITHSSKNAVENHFDTSYELEAMLEARVKRQLLDEVQSICPPGVTIMHIRQGHAEGLGHAVLCAKPLVGNEPFAVLLPDVLIDDAKSDLTKDNLAQLVKRFDETGVSQVLVHSVEPEALSNYSVISCENPIWHRVKVVVLKPWSRSHKAQLTYNQTCLPLGAMFCLLIFGHCWNKPSQVPGAEFN